MQITCKTNVLILVSYTVTPNIFTYMKPLCYNRNVVHLSEILDVIVRKEI